MAERPTNPWVSRATLVFLVGAMVVLVVLLKPGLVRFWPFTVAEFVQLITPLFLIALLIERALEVFVTSFRGAGAAKKELTVKEAEAQVQKSVAGAEDALIRTKQELVDYKARSQRYAFVGGVAIGLVVGGIGIRVLQLFVDPAVFAALSPAQRGVFTATDVLLTGAVIGGGAEAMHKLVSVFTNFMDSAAKRAKTLGEETSKG